MNNLKSKPKKETEQIVIRSMRSGFTWLDNVVVDDWAHLIGPAVFSLYVLYCRRAMNNTQSTKLPQEVIAEHFRLRKLNISEGIRILEWCDLIKVVRHPYNVSTVYLKDTKPLTPELRVMLRESLAQGTDYLHLRKMLINRLDNFLSLNERLDLFMLQSNEKEYELIQPDEHETEPDSSPELPPSVNPLTVQWQEVKDVVRGQMTQATFDTWVKSTELVSIEGNQWLIQCGSTFAQEWLENRLNGTLTRTASSVAGQAVELKFIVRS